MTTQGDPTGDSGRSDEEQAAHDRANDELMNEDDEREAQERLRETGEPVRDRLGNESGSS